jgi:GTP-binding protein EngB required for normal cell division
VLAATKADKLGRGERQRRLAALRASVGARAQAVVAVSARDGSGVDELWRVVWSAVAPEKRRVAAGRGD